MNINPHAGKLLDASMLVDVSKLINAYYTGLPDPKVQEQRIVFGTSGHRGSSFRNSFNENHIIAITQAICLYRKFNQINGPIFLGFDTHALSAPAFETTMEVLAAYKVEVIIAEGGEYTPTPVISYAILNYNLGRKTGLADGIVLTPSHNPPDEGGFKYNPPTGGPAGTDVTAWIESKANELMSNNLSGIKRMSFQKALKASSTQRRDLLHAYVGDLGSIIDMDLLSDSKIHIGVDPLGGAGLHYWDVIGEKYLLNLSVVSRPVDATFSFMAADWDGKIRMDPSSSYAMKPLIETKDTYDISFACDTDHDRHGIVTRSAGLLAPNHYLSVAISYLLQHRPLWSGKTAIGKTIVTTQLIDRIVAKLGRKVYEVPVGFKWFVEGLLDESLCFAGEESAGASFSRLDGRVWTTDKDGIVPALLSAEITAKMGKDPGVLYQELTDVFGEPFYDRLEAKATLAQQALIKTLSASQIQRQGITGQDIKSISTEARSTGSPIGGIKVETAEGWFVVRPSGTEDLYKIYAESFSGEIELKQLMEAAQGLVDLALISKK